MKPCKLLLDALGTYQESQRPVVMGYCQPTVGCFRVQRPLSLGYLAFQVVSRPTMGCRACLFVAVEQRVQVLFPWYRSSYGSDFDNSEPAGPELRCFYFFGFLGPDFITVKPKMYLLV